MPRLFVAPDRPADLPRDRPRGLVPRGRDRRPERRRDLGRQRRPRARRARRDRLPAQRRRRPARVRRAAGRRRLPGARARRLPPTGEATEVKLAVGDGHRIAVVWVADGNVYANVSQRHAHRPGPFTGRSRSAGRTRATSTSTSASTAPPTPSGSRRATCAPRACRTRPGPAIAPPLDVDPALEAGTGPLRPKVAVSAEGYAVGDVGRPPPRGSHARVGAAADRAEPVGVARRT